MLLIKVRCMTTPLSEENSEEIGPHSLYNNWKNWRKHLHKLTIQMFSRVKVNKLHFSSVSMYQFINSESDQ